jgi:hypothetical protein
MYRFLVVFVIVLFRNSGNRSKDGSSITTKFLAPKKINAFKHLIILCTVYNGVID